MPRKKRNAPAAPPAEPVPVLSDEIDPSSEQSGDLQGLSDVPGVDAESVRELAEEGQSYEAEVVDGVENAPNADAGPVRVRKRREDDIPPEYTDHPLDEPKE